jgi:hypothetical protein
MMMQTYRMRMLWHTNCTTDELVHLRKFSNTHFQCEASKFIPAIFFGAANLFPVLVFLPFYDRIIYTWLSGWKWFSMLARMAWGNAFILVSIISAIAIEVVRIRMLSETLLGDDVTHVSVTVNAMSFHRGASTFDIASPLPRMYVIIPYFFFAFAEVFSNITGKCRQGTAPLSQ